MFSLVSGSYAQRNGVAQVSVANAVTSLRLCATLDWPEYVETVSLVEHVPADRVASLASDPEIKVGRYTRPNLHRIALDGRTARVGQAQELGDLVEGLAGGIVEGGAHEA